MVDLEGIKVYLVKDASFEAVMLRFVLYVKVHS